MKKQGETALLYQVGGQTQVGPGARLGFGVAQQVVERVADHHRDIGQGGGQIAVLGRQVQACRLAALLAERLIPVQQGTGGGAAQRHDQVWLVMRDFAAQPGRTVADFGRGDHTVFRRAARGMHAAHLCGGQAQGGQHLLQQLAGIALGRLASGIFGGSGRIKHEQPARACGRDRRAVPDAVLAALVECAALATVGELLQLGQRLALQQRQWLQAGAGVGIGKSGGSRRGGRQRRSRACCLGRSGRHGRRHSHGGGWRLHGQR